MHKVNDQGQPANEQAQLLAQLANVHTVFFTTPVNEFWVLMSPDLLLCYKKLETLLANRTGLRVSHIMATASQASHPLNPQPIAVQSLLVTLTKDGEFHVELNRQLQELIDLVENLRNDLQ